MADTEKLSPQERITRSIVAAVEAGVAPWNCPWDSSGSLSAPLRSNGKAYTGINVLALWCEARSKGYHSRTWFTFNQAKELGACVRKGEKSSVVVYYGTAVKKPSGDAEETSKGFRFLKSYNVFNACQIDGLPDHYTARPEVKTVRTWSDLGPLDAWSHATGVTITEGGAQAFYRPSVDAVTMPDRYRFKEAEPFYATLFHELTHATGHGTRVGRDFNASKRWGDSAYAMEELVAELGAAFLCSHHGVSKAERADHASYIASWLKVLKSDSRAIFKAAADAQAAVNWLVTRAGGAVETEEVGQALAA